MDGTTGITETGTAAKLTFSGTGTHAILNSSAGTNLTIDAGTTGKVLIGATSTGDVELAGGAVTGCIVTNSTGTLTCVGDLSTNSGNLTTISSTATVFNTNATTLSLGGAATTALNIGNGAGAYTAINIGSGNGGNVVNLATGTGSDTVNIATGGTNPDTINIGNTGVATVANISSGATTQNIITENGTSLTTGNFIALNSDSNRTALAVNNQDVNIAGQKDQTAIANTTNTYVYDTTKDPDGGLWTNDERAKASSWYNETLDNIGSSCILGTDDRCGRREFPTKAILVATTTTLDIYDSKDNTLWMTFNKGSGATEQMIGPTTNSTGSTVFAINGKIYFGNNGSVGGLYVIDFKGDRAQRFNATDDYVGNKNIGTRNTTVTWTAGPLSPLASTIVEDVHGIIYAGKTFIAVANDIAISVINETDRNVYSYSDVTNDLYKATRLSRAGDLYGLNSTSKQLERWNNVTADAGSELNGTPDFVWDETTVPALFTTAQTVNTAPDALFVSSGTSDIDGKSDTIYVGTATNDSAGDLTVINDKKGDETKGSAKYYTNSYITEEMIGDIRGMWPLDTNFGTGLSDASVKAETLTNNGAATFATSGVRGFGGSFNGTTQYLSKADDANLSVTGSVSFGAWFKTTSATTNQFIISKNGSYSLEITAGSKVQGVITGGTTGTRPSANSIDTGWHHAVVVYDASAQTLNVYLDGILNNGSLAGTVPASITDSANAFNIGADNGATFFGGTIDEPFVSSTVLTASEIRHIYEVGSRALQNHTASRITGVTGADNYQRLMGNVAGGTSSTNRVFAVSLDDGNQFVYAGLNDSVGNTGGVTAIGIDSDTATDLYDGTANTDKKTDSNSQFSANDSISLSIAGFPCIGYNAGTTNCASKATLSLAGTDDVTIRDWMETSNTSLYSTLATLTSPNSVKNAVTVNNMFQVFNTYNNLSQSSTGENIQTPAFSVDSSGYLVYNYLGTNTGAIGSSFNDGNLIAGDLMRLTETNASHTGSALDIVYGGADAGFPIRINDDGTATDTTPFVVTGTGKVGIGKTAPLFNLDVNGNASISATLSLGPMVQGSAGVCNATNAGKEYYDGPTNTYFFCNGTVWTQISTGGASAWTFDTTNGVIYPISSTADVLIGGTSTASAKFAFKNILTGTPTIDVSAQATNIAIKDGTTASLNILEAANSYLAINTNNGTESLNFGNSTTNPTYNFLGTTTVNLATPIDFLFTPAGGQVYLADNATLNVGGLLNKSYNAFANATDSVAATVAVTSDNDLYIGGDLEIKGGLYLTGKNIFNLVGTVPTTTISFASDPSLLDRYNTLGNGSWLVNDDANLAGIAALMVTHGAQNSLGDLIDATPSSALALGATVLFRVTNTSDVFLGDNTGTDLTVGGGTGKIDVGTVDPPYLINGKKFATFLSGMVGVKEETAGLVNTNEYVPGVGYRSIIDFNSLQEGSDLWLFGKSTNIKENIDKLVALLTPSTPTHVWYDVDKTNKKLVIYSARPTEISYRLTGPRFDYQNFPNQRDSAATGFIINSLDTINNSLVVADVQQLASYVTEKVQDGFYTLRDSSGTIIDGVESIGNFVAGNIKAGAIAAQELAANNIITDSFKTNLISPIPGGTDVTFRLGNDATTSGKLAIQDKTGTEVASIDTQGNATFSGTVHSQNIDDIQSLLNQVASDQSVLLAATSGANFTATSSANISQLIATDLYVTDHAAITSLLVNDNLTVGNINSLSGPLQIQSLALAPVEIMDGLVTIDTHGNVNIAGDLNVAGKITTPQLDAGIINATGSATFNSLSTGGLIIGAPDATVSGVVSNGEITTNSTIGKAVIPAGTSEIVIKNSKVTDYTLVYVTPTSDTANNVLYIKSKQAGQFVVGFTNPINTDASFNWWVVQIQ